MKYAVRVKDSGEAAWRMHGIAIFYERWMAVQQAATQSSMFPECRFGVFSVPDFGEPGGPDSALNDMSVADQAEFAARFVNWV